MLFVRRGGIDRDGAALQQFDECLLAGELSFLTQTCRAQTSFAGI
jgi:hypothetical protein